MSIAIITGASSGLGREYARAVRAQRAEIDEIWLIARRQDRLEALAEELKGARVVCLPLDLSDKEKLGEYEARLRGEKAQVSLLINNAGFGRLGDFYGANWRDQAAMVDLNDSALTAITAITLPHMARGGAIVNICSIASFVPTPRMAVYCSTKAYVMSFSRALRYELREKGINVLAVCPGPMDTEFLPVAGIGEGKSRAFDTLPRDNPRAIAQGSLRAAFRGRAVYTGRGVYGFYRVLGKLLPHSWLLKFTAT